MQAIKLPRTLDDFRTCLNVDSNKELGKILKDSSSLAPDQEQILKYSGAALAAGRPLDSTIICVAGATGAGKSTTINSFYCDNSLCKTNSWTSETSKIVFIRKSLKVTKESPPILTQLCFADMPGYFDTNSHKEEAKHHAQLRQFKESRIELAKRTHFPFAFHFYYSIPKSVYPNLVLFVIKATDNRLGGESSQLMKSLKLLKANGDLVDKNRNNLIVVVTHVMELGRKMETIMEKFKAIKKIVSYAAWDTFGLTDVDIVPIENDPEEYDLKKKGDYYELPIKDNQGNNELSHHNLYQAMKERLNDNKDLLGKLCMAWYSNTECPDRAVPAEIIDTHIPIGSVELAQAAMEMSLDSDVADDLPKMCQFQSLGYGFCPVTEKVMPSSPLKYDNKREVVEIAKSKFLIPAGVSVFKEKVSRSHFLTFFKKEEYESHMHNSYGIEAGVRLVVNASFKGKWVEEAKGSEQQSCISQIHEIQVANLRLNDPNGHAKHANFQKTLDNLPAHYSEETAPEFRSFFSRWGSHLIYEQGIGGSIQLTCAVKEQKITREKLSEIENKLKGVFQRLLMVGDGSAKYQSKEDTNALRTIGIDNEQLEISGGDPPPLPTLNSFTSGQLVKWSETVSSEPAELKKTMKLFPYYNLIEGSKSHGLRKATEDYLKSSLLGKAENEFNQNMIANNDLEEVIDAPAKESSCFPKGTSILVDGGNNAVAIENLARSLPLQLTTLILQGSGKMKIGKISDTKFCTFLDAKPTVEIEYIALTFTNGKKLLVSEAHMIFQYVPRKQVVIGKQAKYFKIGDMTIYTDSPGKSLIQYPVVTKITKEKHLGAYSPLTMSGTFLADGFLVSSYANVISFKIAQWALAPLKIWCFTQNFRKSTKPNYDYHINGGNCGEIHPYAKVLIAFRKSFTKYKQ